MRQMSRERVQKGKPKKMHFVFGQTQKRAFSNLLRFHLGRSELVRESKAALKTSSALVELTATGPPGNLLPLVSSSRGHPTCASLSR